MNTIYFLNIENASAEENAAKNWLINSFPKQTKIITFADLQTNNFGKNPGNLLWIHSDRFEIIDLVQTQKIKGIFNQFFNSGSGVFCTGLAAELSCKMGFESSQPDILLRENWQQEIGEHQIRGIFGYSEHPVFALFFGGIYTWRPTSLEKYSIVAYSGNNCPEDCKVIGVERYHIGFDDSVRIMWERSIGGGILLCVGAYTYFNMQDQIYKDHLSEFIKSCFTYLQNGKISKINRVYFEPNKKGIFPFKNIEFSESFPKLEISDFYQKLKFESTTPNSSFWDLAGRKSLVVGKEEGGIEEIWFHPFQGLKNFHWFINHDFKKLQATKFTTYHDRIERNYLSEFGELKETVVCLLSEPVILVKVEADSKPEFKIKFEMNSDLRLMWPYKPGVLGKIGFQKNKSSIFLFDENQENFVAILANQPFDSTHFRDTSNKNYSEIAIELEFYLSELQPIEIVIIGLNENVLDGVNKIRSVLSWLEQNLKIQKNHFLAIEHSGGEITTPDEQVNTALKFAKLKLDSFVIDLPETGTGLFAGYAATLPDWFSSRPGYAWYFGRDSVWSAFALLHLGRFDVVKSILTHMITYQEFTEKIYHEMTSSGVVHYDAADSTPLFLILVAKYHSFSGNVKFIIDNWTSIKKAFEFCQKTDFDSDGFIENTNVGHGWIEGGKLCGAHVTHYLAGIWIQALKVVEDLALLMNENKMANFCSKRIKKINQKYQTQFWLGQDDHFAYGIDVNGEPLKTLTTMPTVGILFNSTEKEKSIKTLRKLDSLEFCSDWGVRMISDHHPDFEPKGYHMGSIWPLYTGWQSLADYKVGRTIPAWMHWMHQIPLFQYYSKGNMPEVLRGDYFEIAGICPHQAWSEAMALLPLYQGMLSLQPDVPENRLQMSPQIPDIWPELKIEKINFGKNLYDFQFKRKGSVLNYSFILRKGKPFFIKFQLIIPNNFSEQRIFVNGEEFVLQKESENCGFEFLLTEFTQIKVVQNFYLRFMPEIYLPQLGQSSRGYIVTDEKFEENEYRILIHGKSAEKYKGKLLFKGISDISIKNAEVVDTDSDYFDLFFKMPESAKQYQFLEIRIAYHI